MTARRDRSAGLRSGWELWPGPRPPSGSRLRPRSVLWPGPRLPSGSGLRSAPGRAGLLAAAAVAATVAAAAVGAVVSPAIASPAGLRASLDRFASSAEARGLEYSVLFVPLDTRAPGEDGPLPEPSVAVAVDRPLVPASLAKIATSVAALEQFGPSHTFATHVFARGPIEEGALCGDLVVVGGGDPFLVTERLWMLANELRMSGLRRVRGGLVVDGSAFAPEQEDPIRSDLREFSRRPYGARLSAFAVNFGAAGFRLRPAPTAGDTAVLVTDPLPNRYLALDNRILTAGRDAPGSWSIQLEREGEGERVIARGKLREGGPEEAIYRSVADPQAFAAGTFRAVLESAGIGINGATSLGARAPEDRLLVEFESPPLADLVRSLMRHSNNFMADMIAASLASGLDGGDSLLVPASLTLGGEALTRWLHARFDAPAAVVLLDGSGLNEASRLTAGTVARVLLHGWSDLTIQPELVSSMAMPGRPGTLRRRFRAPEAPVIRAKTGTMSDPMASGLAGFLETADGPALFVVMMNAARGSGWTVPRLQELQERWVREYAR